MSSEPTVASGTGEPIAAEAAGRGLRHGFRALHHRDFALFWSAALVSNVGTWMQNVTVPYVLFHLTGSAAWVGLAAFAQFLPMMLPSPSPCGECGSRGTPAPPSSSAWSP